MLLAGNVFGWSWKLEQGAAIAAGSIVLLTAVNLRSVKWAARLQNLTAVSYLVAVFVFFVGALGIVRSRNLIHAVVCLSVAQAGTYLLLLAVGFQKDAQPPVFGSPATSPSRRPTMWRSAMVCTTSPARRRRGRRSTCGGAPPRGSAVSTASGGSCMSTAPCPST